MQLPEKILKLFDVRKYREIQPIIEGIAQRSASAEQVICLLEAAISATETDDFKKYNDFDDVEGYAEKLQKIVEIIQKSNISTWFEMLNQKKYYGIDILYTLFSFICCPRYQETAFDITDVSDTMIKYGSVYFCYSKRDLNLFRLLDPSSLVGRASVESLPVEMKDEGFIFNIFSQQQLALITEAAKEDILILSQKDHDLDENDMQSRQKFLEFYNCFNHLLSLANSRPEYTLFNEQHNS